MAVCPEEDARQKAFILHHWAILKAQQGDVQQAINLYQQSLALKESIGDVRGKAMTLWWLGGLADQGGDPASAISYLQEAHEILQRLGSSDAVEAQALLEQVRQVDQP